VWKCKGDCLRMLDNRAGAIECYNEALRLKPDDVKIKQARDSLRAMDRALYPDDM
ncbi:tetratricopeptide repeat protein, partial [Methanococcoides sp. SA1]|nr:tetratricopeptide repeat protein [Methanococcoides sp. SA1]